MCATMERLPPCGRQWPFAQPALPPSVKARIAGGNRSCASRIHCRAQARVSAKDAIVVVVPGWLSDCSQYEPMASHLRDRGLHTMIVALKWYNWIPSLGGRSVRPVLDRINATLEYALNNEKDGCQNQGRYFSEDYTFLDFVKEVWNPKKGARGNQPLSKVCKEPTELTALQQSPRKAILVAHSAGGWICRILLGSQVPYDGRIYSAASNVQMLVTLGTPHICTDKLTKRNMEFVSKHYPGAAEAENGVEYICVAGRFACGKSLFGGLWKDFAWQSYELCCGKGDVWGDGVIPVECAIALEGAQHIILDDVEHFPSAQEKKGSWYGSPDVVDKWFPFLKKRTMNQAIDNPVAV